MARASLAIFLDALSRSPKALPAETGQLRLRFLMGFMLIAVVQPALGSQPLDSIQKRAVEAGVDRHPLWLKLVHYEPERESKSGLRSAVVSPTFFLHQQGADDPRAELLATLTAFKAHPGVEPDKHAQCAFPARHQFLRKELELDLSELPEVRCADYARWTLDGQTDSVSLVLATGFLGNPASFYGHILLKFNAGASRESSSLLDVSVNYGAIVPDNVDPVSYIVKGVFGGYSGGFSHIEFFYHNHNYSENELRDLWEYRLALSPDEVRLVVGHAWELVGKKFTYYFFRENCAFRMAELIELVEGFRVMPKRPWTIPQDLIQSLYADHPSGRMLVSEVLYHPSRQSRFYTRYARMDEQARTVFFAAARNPALLSGEDFQQLSESGRIAVADALIDYFKFVGDDTLPASHAFVAGHAAALNARFALPPHPDTRPALASRAPHLGRPIGLLGTGVAHDDKLGVQAVLELRPAYYDALDAGAGHSAYSSLTMADTRLTFDETRVRLQRIDFMRVESLSGGVTGLPGDDGDIWRIRVGLETQQLSCDACLVARGQAAAGKSLHLSDQAVAGVYVGGMIQSARNDESVVLGQLAAFASYRAYGRFSGRVDYEYRQPVGGRLDHRHLVSFESRLGFGQDHDLRLRFDSHDVERVSLVFGTYW